ncbi:centrosomal protein 15 isoform X2 [Mobula birostris]|uniref:centrosomal protein 15 isoform X2 n=1 Tax=Mobula birostris TaxID=1983395 RepID=UPI003B285742
MKMSYLAHEVELSKRHEKILSLRATLLQQMEDQLESQDLEAAEKNLRAGVHVQLHPAVIALETKYWASIEEQLPKWEQLFLGQTRNPVEVRNARHKQSQNELLQDKDTIQITNLPSPVSTFKTPPRFPQLRKQKKQTHKT